MIEQINELPENMVGFRASGEVTQQDYINVVHPIVQKLEDRKGKINFLLVLQNSTSDFTIGAWAQDALLGLKHLLHWNRVAIVSDQTLVRKFTDLMSPLVPGEYRGFKPSELQEAIEWCAASPAVSEA